jgi:hypothetical protein
MMPITRRARLVTETARLLRLQLHVLRLEGELAQLLDEEERVIRAFHAGWDALEPGRKVEPLAS